MAIKRSLLFLFVLLAFVKVPAQLCAGSLGDPIVNITFGAGPNPGPALSTTTNLQYVDTDCPIDGSYAIRNSTQQCPYHWHALASDHTGDPNGYFMLVNASYEPSQFYLDTVRGLCPNTTYEFAAWIVNVILPSTCAGGSIKPNLTFSIETTDGTILKTNNTGDIDTASTPIWKQYGFFFTTPSSASDIVLRIKNNASGGCGNDIAIDDITFRPCGPMLTPSIKGVADLVKELCVGKPDDVAFNCSVSEGFKNPVFQWQKSSNNGSTWTDIAGANSTSYIKHFPSTAPVGNYLYRLTVAEATNIVLPRCRVASSAFTVHINSDPVTSVSVNDPICEGSPINFTATGGVQYSWSGVNSFSGSDASVTIGRATAKDAGKYFVTTTSTAGCSKTDSISIKVNPSPVAKTGFKSTSICAGDSILLQSFGGVSYSWLPSTGLSSSVISNPVAKPASPTRYLVVVYDGVSCTDTAEVDVNVIYKPKAVAGPDKVILEGQSVQLSGSVEGVNTSVTWSPVTNIINIFSLQPVVSPKTDKSYILTARSNDGCGISTDTAKVFVYKEVIIPNAFSPNGDGINDTWNISGISAYNNYELSVFNRYGQAVFSTRDYSKPWNGTLNGKPLPVGTYYYLLDNKTGLPKLNGFVVILR